MKKTILMLTTLALAAGVARADVLAQWTFNDTSSLTAALGSSGVPAGITVSGLVINDSFGFAGLNNVPNTVHDGFGFGGNQGQAVIFLHRAEYFDNSAVPVPRPSTSDYTSFGLSPHETQGTGAGPGNGNAPISFTVTAGASDLRIDSLSVDLTSAGTLLFTFQEAGAAEGAATTVDPGNTGTAVLASPVVISAGQTKTFTVNLANYALNTYHNINGFQLNGVDLSFDGSVDTLSPSGETAPTVDLIATYSEDIAIGTGTITIKNLTTGALRPIDCTDTNQVSVSGSVLTVDPISELDYGMDYAVRIEEGVVENLTGNSFPAVEYAQWGFSIEPFDDAVTNLAYAFTASPGADDTRSWTPDQDSSFRLVGTIQKPLPGTAGEFRVLADGSEIYSRSFGVEDTLVHAFDISAIDLTTSSLVEFIASVPSGSSPVEMTAEMDILPEPYLSDWSAALPSGYPNFSEAEKVTLRQNGQAVLQQIRNRAAVGATRVVILPGDYLFNANWSSESTLSNISDMEIIAYGATFWFEPRMVHGLLFQNCSDVTLRGLTIDFTVPCWSQATITQIDRQANTMTATLMPGYEPTDEYGVAETSGERKMIFYTPDGEFINHQHTRGDWQLTGGGTSITYSNISVSGIPDALEVGDYVVSPIQTGAALRTKECARMRYEDVNVWSSPGQAINQGEGEGGHVYHRVRATRRPNTNRLQAFGADVFHLSAGDIGPTLNRCESAYGADDNINIHGRFGWIIEQGAAANLYYMAGSYEVGDTLEFRDDYTVELLGIAQVLSVGPNTTTNEADFLVELDQSLSLPVGAMIVMDGKDSASGFVVRNCWFHDNFQRTLINGTPRGLFEENTLQNVGHGINIQFETWGPWYEGPFARNVTVRNNRFLDVDPGGFTISVSMHPRGTGSNVRQFDAQPFTNLTFSGNYFSQTDSGIPVSIHNVNGLFIQSNVVERAPYVAVEPLYLQDCTNVVIESNWISPPPPFANGDFSENAAAFTNNPGYTGGSNPESIFAWTHNGTGGTGINGAGLSTLFGPADPSAATYYAFLQDAGSQLAQDMSSTLEPDTTYRISYVAANRNGDTAALGRVTVADDSVTYYDSGIQDWGTAAFQAVSTEFTTGAVLGDPVVITLSNESPAGDNTVVYSNIEIVKVSGYDTWAADYGLTGVVASASFDVEPDGMDNLMEYALGGNPTNSDAALVLPVIGVVPDGGSNWFYHIHNERTDDPTLTYTVELNTNLVDGTWSTNGVEKTGESGVVNDFKSVTNRTDVGGQEFIRLKIEQD